MVSSTLNHHLWQPRLELKQQREEGKPAFLTEEALLQILKSQSGPNPNPSQKEVDPQGGGHLGG